jgi:tetratricopeptide (TPR) repeat protein
MDHLYSIIQGMNKEDIRFFKLFKSRTNSSESRKDLQLFDLIKKQAEKYNDDDAFEKLYGTSDKNSFYRLKNRLFQDVSTSIFIQNFEKDDVIYIYYLISLARYFINRNKYDEARYFLLKAEKKAQSIESFELLDIVYTDFIRLSGELVTYDPNVYIEKRKQTIEKINQLRQIDDILAIVSYRIRVTQNFSHSANPIFKLLEKIISEFSDNEELKKSPTLRFRIYDAVSRMLLQKREYLALEDYLLKTYDQFILEKLFHKTNHQIKLQMLTYLVNTLFKNKKHKQSLEYAQKLKHAMEEFNGFLFDKYAFFYYNSLVINYSAIDPDKAVETLEDLKKNEKIKKTSFYEVFIYLNLAIVWFDKKDFHKAIANLNKLNTLEGFRNTDESFKFKVAVAELIMRFELNDFDFLEYRIKQIKKDYEPLLSRPENIREKDLIEIVEKLMVTPDLPKNKELMQMIRDYTHTAEISDTEVINYNNWLKEKMKS